MANTLPVSYVVNVEVNMSPVAAALRNFGNMLIVGSSDVINVQERIRTYGTAEEVAGDFGIDAPEYKAALVYFAQSPRPRLLEIGRWAKSSAPALLHGATLPAVSQAISNFNTVTAGTFSIEIDGKTVSLTGIDLSGESNLNGVASVVSEALGANGTCVWNGTAFEVRTASSGASSSIRKAEESELSGLMGLGSAASVIAGADAESLEACFADLLGFNTWYGAFVAAEYDAADAVAVSAQIEAATPARIVAFTSQDSRELDAGAEESLGSQLKALGRKRSLVMYSGSAPYAALSILGRMATVNFQGSNTTITLKFKQAPGVVAENLRTAQARALKAKNVNVFAAYQNDTSILQEGTMANGYFIDEVHGLDWLQNQVETDLWNLLYTATTKIGQDENGANALVATVASSLERGVNNGLIAPGVWNGDEFGALKKGDTLAAGYYVYIQPMDEQAQSDREARKAPPIQVAVKLRGAIHFADVTITVNR